MKFLYNHTNQETAYMVQDYPWGYKLRTTIRYWIESKPDHGQRFCRQTINPKTGKWCAPKCGTYSPIEILYLNENGHVSVKALTHWASEEEVVCFKNTHINFLTDFQKDQLKHIIARNNVMKHVSFEFKPAFALTEEEKESGEREQERVKLAICNAIDQEYGGIRL